MAIVRLPWVRPAPERTVFVLGGGGNLGAIQVGMLAAVLERGTVPDAIVACSAGAINGAGLAADPTVAGIDRLADAWRSVPETAMAGGRFDAVRLLAHRGPALQDNLGLRTLLETLLPIARFEECRVPLHVVATSLRSGRERWFSEGPLVAPILASAALPGVFPPVTIAGETLIDGGVINNVPVSKAFELGATRVIVFHVGNFDRPRPMPRRPIEVLIQAFSIARSARFHVDVERGAPPGVEVTVLPAVDPGRLRYNDFSRSAELIERGHAAAADHLDGRLAAAR